MDTHIQRGRYRHYKGGEYEVLGTAMHSETEEWMVVYKPLYNNPKADLWVRPLAMFKEHVEINGTQIPRFTFLK